MAPVLAKLRHELGVEALADAHARRDLFLLVVSRFIRMLGFGAIAPILVLYLNLLGFTDRSVGLFLSLTLAGDVALSLVISWLADSIGRRRFVFYLSRNYVVLLVAAALGVISPSGNEVGPFSSVEVGILSQLVEPENRVFVLMHYQVLGFVGLAVGSLVAGSAISTLDGMADKSLEECYGYVFLAYGLIAVVKVILSLSLSEHVELDPRQAALPQVGPPTERQPLLRRRPLYGRTASATPHLQVPAAAKVDVSPPSPTASDPEVPSSVPLLRLALVVALFSVDSFASSLTPASYVSLYFKDLYHASIRLITTVLAGSALGAVVTSLAAGALAKRIGLVLTMVTTHIPAQLLTAGMAFAPSLPSVVALYILRTCISSMDSSIRGALLSAMVPKTSRTRLLGVVDVARTLAAAPGPFVTGRLVEIDAFRWVFVLSGAIKIAYDIALLLALGRAQLQH
ncbi:uncharacterized protein JCM10292_004247 [Rhodotorula paludigena]|uniref:uncharacterized protein n=1 Tax=Rhodotorula paludigena TaxID=86838 RepID=UPI00317CA7F7